MASDAEKNLRAAIRGVLPPMSLQDAAVDAADYIAELEVERDELREVIELLIQDEWGYRETEAPDVQDVLTARGILVEAPAPEHYREEFEADTWFVLRWSDAARGDNDAE